MLTVTAEEFGMLCASQEVRSSIGSSIASAQLHSAAKPQKAKAKLKGSIADTIRQGIRDELDNKAILKLVQKKHKGCNTTMACVYWYQSRFNRGLEK